MGETRRLRTFSIEIARPRGGFAGSRPSTVGDDARNRRAASDYVLPIARRRPER
jgi:hypothetical protein